MCDNSEPFLDNMVQCETLWNNSEVQTINQSSIAPISPLEPGSMVRPPNQCSTAKPMKQLHDINGPSVMLMSMEEGWVKDMCFETEGCNWGGWTDWWQCSMYIQYDVLTLSRHLLLISSSFSIWDHLVQHIVTHCKADFSNMVQCGTLLSHSVHYCQKSETAIIDCTHNHHYSALS